jgi:hypothetical protein
MAELNGAAIVGIQFLIFIRTCDVFTTWFEYVWKQGMILISGSMIINLKVRVVIFY